MKLKVSIKSAWWRNREPEEFAWKIPNNLTYHGERKIGSFKNQRRQIRVYASYRKGPLKNTDQTADFVEIRIAEKWRGVSHFALLHYFYRIIPEKKGLKLEKKLKPLLSCPRNEKTGKWSMPRWKIEVTIS